MKTNNNNNQTAKLITRNYCYGFQVPCKVLNALCEDGIRRTAYTHQETDTYFSIPARIVVKNKSIKGFITAFENEYGESDYKFIAYQNNKPELLALINQKTANND